MVFAPKCTVFFQSCTNSVALICIFLKTCTTKEKSCTSLVHCPWLLISFTMVLVANCAVFSKAVQILWSSYNIFLKSCTTIEKLHNQRKKLYIFGTLSLALNFIHSGVCTEMYSFFPSCTTSVVIIYIFLKTYATIKKLWNQRKKLYILVHCPCLLISFTMVFVPKCTAFSIAVQILWSSYNIFLKGSTTIKKLYNQIKKLYIFGTLSLALKFIHNGVCTKMYSFFPKLYKFCGPHIYIFKKMYNQRKKLHIFGTLSMALHFIHNGVCIKMYSFFQSCTNSVALICIFLKSCPTFKSCTTKEKSCTSLVHCPWLLISFTMVFVPKCTVSSKAVQLLWSSYIYF